MRRWGRRLLLGLLVLLLLAAGGVAAFWLTLPKDRVAVLEPGALTVAPAATGEYDVGALRVSVGDDGVRIEEDGRVVWESPGGRPFVTAARGRVDLEAPRLLLADGRPRHRLDRPDARPGHPAGRRTAGALRAARRRRPGRAMDGGGRPARRRRGGADRGGPRRERRPDVVRSHTGCRGARVRRTVRRLRPRRPAGARPRPGAGRRPG